jgi:hypothetical protein
VEAYELSINPANESFYLPHPEGGTVQFENLVGDALQDGKLIQKPRSIYHVADLPPFAQGKALQEARRQLEAAGSAGLQVEWLVSDQKAVDLLTELFRSEGLGVRVTLRPE